MPHRQVVRTTSKRLRACCLYRRRLLGEIARVAARTVTATATATAAAAAIRTRTGERELAVGIVACLQARGPRANWHPHFHLLVTDGGFRPDGTFGAWPVHDTARLTEAFRRAVLRLFVRVDLFDEEQAASRLTWPHAGFHVRTAGQTAGTETADPLEFMARVLVHIPDKGHITTRDHGWYAHRGHPPVGGVAATELRGGPPRVPRMPWPLRIAAFIHQGVAPRPDPHAPPHP